MNDYNDFFNDESTAPEPERTPVYHTREPKPSKRNNVVMIICIVIAAIMTLLVIVNVIVLATLKDSIADEFAAQLSDQFYQQYSDAISDALKDKDIIDDVKKDAAQSVMDALNSTIGEVAETLTPSVARIYMYKNAADNINSPSGMATAFLITDSTEASTERYLVTNAHCVRYVGTRSTSVGGIFGGSRTENYWTSYAKFIAVFDNDEHYYTLVAVAYGAYTDDKLAAEYDQPDLALLKVQGTQPSNEDHPSLPIAAGDYSKRGTPIALIGNPEGIGTSNSVSTGCISQTDITISSWGSGRFIMTDAALNSGNSGGPMVNRLGVVVGVAESKLVEESIDNMAFAVSAGTLRDFIDWAKAPNNNSTGSTLSINCTYVNSIEE